MDIETEMEELRKENINYKDSITNLKKDLKSLREYNEVQKSQRDKFFEKVQVLEIIIQHQLKMNDHFMTFRKSVQKEMQQLQQENEALKDELALSKSDESVEPIITPKITNKMAEIEVIHSKDQLLADKDDVNTSNDNHNDIDIITPTITTSTNCQKESVVDSPFLCLMPIGMFVLFIEGS